MSENKTKFKVIAKNLVLVGTCFYSYENLVAHLDPENGEIELTDNALNISKTTSRHCNKLIQIYGLKCKN